MAHYQGDIPLNADKKLFAEDLIYWYLLNRWPRIAGRTVKRADVSDNSVDNYREFIYNAFDMCMQIAIEFIDDFLYPAVLSDFVSMQNANRLNIEAFTEYANDYHGRYFADGFDAKNFLEYCVRLANMAGSFHSEGTENVLPLTVDLIVKAFPEGDMFSGGWEILKQTAKRFVKMDYDCAMELTPIHSAEASPSSYSSDSN